MSASRTTLLVAATAAALATAANAQGRRLGGIERRHVQEQAFVDTDGDGVFELLLVMRSRDPDGAGIARLRWRDDTLAADGRMQCDDPQHTLVTFADVLDQNGTEVVFASPRHTACRSWQAPDDEVRLVRGAKFDLRVDELHLSPFVLDLNQDGRLDLMLPRLNGVEPYLQEEPQDGVPGFRRMDTIAVPVDRTVGTGSGGLDQELVGGVTIPRIRTADLNGDGRPDLLTGEGKVRRYHLQRGDGRFGKAIELDLEQFVDSTPKAVIELGETLVASDEQQLQRGDVSGDGIPDYVIAHRRKVWTFVADATGPQFQKARTQAVAEDVSAMLLIDLDEDGKQDLLTARVQLPGIGALILGLVQSIDIDVRAVGYRSDGDGFAAKPGWRRTITLRIPPILSLLGQQDELFERFGAVLAKARISARGDYLGDGRDDLAVVRPDNLAVDLIADVPPAPELDSAEGARLLRELVFEGENPVFDIDRLFALLSGFLEDIGERMTGERGAIATIELRDPTQWRLVDLRAVELDGQPGAELAASYVAADDPHHRAYDVMTWR